MSEWQKALSLGLSVLAVLALIVGLGTSGLQCAAGEEAQVVAHLKGLERELFEHPLDGVTLRATRLDYQRLTVELQSEQVLITATLDFEGQLENRSLISSLGLERIVFAKKNGDWVAVQGYAPTLFKTVAALEARRRRIETQSPLPTDLSAEDAFRLRQMHEVKFQVEHWYIRHEVEGVQITEDSTLTGSLPERPVSEKSSRRLRARSVQGAQVLTVEPASSR